MTQISLKIEDKVKQDAEAVLKDLGFSMSSAIDVFLRTVIREKGIPFSIELENTTKIVPKEINLDLKSEDEIKQYFKRLIKELEDPETKYISLEDFQEIAQKGEWNLLESKYHKL